jgi:hypothetical protein
VRYGHEAAVIWFARQTYTVNILPELPGGNATRYWYPDRALGGLDGLLLVVNPNDGERWIGTFAPGALRANGCRCVFATADADVLGVLVDGASYLVSTADPRTWAMVDEDEVLHLRPIVERSMILYGTRTHLVAYSGLKKLWQTERLVIDDLTLTHAGPDTISGTGAPDTTESFEVDTETGIVRSKSPLWVPVDR